MKKWTLSALFLVLLALIFVPQEEAFAANGPHTGEGAYAYIGYVTNEMQREYKYVYHFDSYKITPAEGISYDLETNTLTLESFSGIALDINEMGDDFRIMLKGNSELEYMTVWGYGYGGSVDFEGDGILSIYNICKHGGNTTALQLNAEQSKARVKVGKDATLELKTVKDIALAIYSTNVKKDGLVLEDGVNIESRGKGTGKLISEREKAMVTEQILVNNVNQQAIVLHKDKTKYYAIEGFAVNESSGQYFPSYWILTEDVEQVEPLVVTDGKVAADLFTEAGYTFSYMETSCYNFYIDGNDIVISSKVAPSADTANEPAAEKTARPKKATITAKQVTGKKQVRLTIGKTEGAEGYQIQMKKAGGSYKTVKTLKKDGSKKRTYTKKSLKKGTYYFRVRAYRVEDGKRIYGKYSKVKKVVIK